jgi:pyruvate/2-oxoglutarate dehydrogenase complex dihydrolipoamide acyltransferase (E2) component
VAHEVRIPKLGVTMETGSITEWLCADGDLVEERQVIYTLSTDKTETDIESPASGRITITGEVEMDYPVGEIVAVIE